MTVSPDNAKTALVNVRVFDGQRLREPGTVIIDQGLIGTDPQGADVIDGASAVLLPGLIDAHVHLHGVENLEQLASFGVTTALDMSTWPPALVDSLRGRSGLTDIRSAGLSATSPGSRHSQMPGRPEGELVAGPAEAERFVAARVAEGSDYIKVIADIPGPDQATLNALVDAAHRHGKLTVAHAVSVAAFGMAQEAKVDIVTHVPRDKALDAGAVARMLNEHRVAVPTLTMMEGVAKAISGAGDYANARDSVIALYRAGVPVFAGTDANAAPGAPFAVAHGESLHHELELLVDAGLSPVEALRAATSLPARYFGFDDRGVIEPGRRADLVLIAGDPTKDIRATRQIQRVWCGGEEYARGLE